MSSTINKKVFECYPKNDKDIICSMNLRNYHIFALQLFASLGLHIFDVGSDIYVLIDQYGRNKLTFACCLTIMILSFLSSSIIFGFFSSGSNTKKGAKFTLKTDERTQQHKPKRQRRCLIIRDSFVGFFQLGIFLEAKKSLDIGEKTHTFIWSRIIEGLLESCPQSLFQLFIVLKNSETYSNEQLMRYYFSIFISVLNLTSALITFEFYRYDYERNIKTNYDLIRTRDLYKQVKKLTITSQYGIMLFIHRLTEISSRMGLLACFGCIFDGFSIIYILSADWIISTIIFVFATSNCCARFHERDLLARLNLAMLLYPFLRQLLFLSSYWKPFTSPLPGETKQEYSHDNYHWITIFTGNGIISGFLIYNLINYYTSLSLSLFVISITSMSCFLINIISLYFIISWNRTNTFSTSIFICCCKHREKEYTHKFKSFTCFKNIALLKCCCNKNIDRKNSGITITTLEEDNDEPINEIIT